MMADPGTVPVRTRSADEIADEIVRLIKEVQDRVLVADVAAKVTDRLHDGYRSEAFRKPRIQEAVTNLLKLHPRK